jgi:hypothetical protein
VSVQPHTAMKFAHVVEIETDERIQYGVCVRSLSGELNANLAGATVAKTVVGSGMSWAAIQAVNSNAATSTMSGVRTGMDCLANV